MIDVEIPPKYATAVDPYQARPWFLDLVREYLAYPSTVYAKGSGVLLGGQNGAGKTWTAVALARAISAAGPRQCSIVFVNSSRLFESIYQYNKTSFEYADGWGESLEWVVENCQSLIVDDLGQEAANRLLVSRMTRLFHQRADNRKYTFVTTNCSLEGTGAGSLQGELGDAVASVLDELCPYQGEARNVRDTRTENVRRFMRDA